MCTARSLVPKAISRRPLIGKLLWMGRTDELTLLDSYDAMRLIDWLGWLLS